MATSGALSTSNDNIKYKITILQNSQNIASNTSNVTVSVKVYRTNTGYTTYGTGTIYLKINGTTYSEAITSDDKITSGGIILIKKTVTIAHSADGSKTLTTSAWINHSQFSASEQSYKMTLTTIPRATTPTVNDTTVNMGESVTISTPRASSSFTHTLKYSFAGATGTIATGVTTSKAWTVPLSLASKIPSATSGKLTITCDTYNGSTKIGSKTVSITISVPSSVKPTISSIAVTEGVSALATKFGAFIRGKSTLDVVVTASGAYSSTIKTYSTQVLGSTFTSRSFSIEKVGTSGSITFSTTVKDSRGRTATLTKTITVLDYNSPTINVFGAIRCNSDGTSNYDGEYALISYGYNIDDLNSKNDKTVTIGLKSADESTYTTIGSSNLYTANTTLIPTSKIDTEKTFQVKLTVKDYFSTINKIIEIPTAFTLMDFHSSGRGIAFGKVAESSDLMDVNLPSRFRKGVTIDSEWVDLTLNEELFALYNASSKPRYKVTGGYVNIIGAVTPIANMETSASTILLASGIPAKYRPPITLNFVCHGSAMNTWLCQVTSGGTITLSRYGLTEFSTILPGNWLPFAVSYAI